MKTKLTSRLRVRSIVIAALCTALCVVLPIAFHSIPNAGSVLSPIHIPVLLCGLICGPFWGLACGIAGPLLSSVITSMPAMAYLPPMLVECAVYGLAAGALMRFVRTGYLYADLYISLLTSMLFGRVVAGAAKALIFAAGEYSFSVWATAYFVTSLPGIVIHLILIPTLVAALQAARLIERRYEK
ncbi:MAG: ECF transporter S component [Clostridia bacterium]|nr:ECF transporter S component [Clostridia bacterium]